MECRYFFLILHRQQKTDLRYSCKNLPRAFSQERIYKRFRLCTCISKTTLCNILSYKKKKDKVAVITILAI